MQTKQVTYGTQTKLGVEGMQPIAQVLQATASTPSTPATQPIKMTQIVRCPNCGELAERHHLGDSDMTRTQCSSCDYLMILCVKTGRVIEAYAPGIRTH